MSAWKFAAGFQFASAGLNFAERNVKPCLSDRKGEPAQGWPRAHQRLCPVFNETFA